MAGWLSDPLWSAEADPGRASPGRVADADESLARAFALCFAGAAGQRVLAHLRRITIERRLGPDASEALLRYVEGQRQLVDTITALVRRGGGRPDPDPGADPAADAANGTL